MKGPSYLVRKIKVSLRRFLTNDALKQKIYAVLFDLDNPKGKKFNKILMIVICFMAFVVNAESLRSMPEIVRLIFKILEYTITVLFTIEYLARIYCSPSPRKYIFSFFGIVDALATIPFYLAFFLPNMQHFLIIRTFRLISLLYIFHLSSIIEEGNLLLSSIMKSINKIVVFFIFVVIIVVIIGTIMFIAEGEHPGSSFDNIPNSIYWAIVTTTTVGYGDITPVTPFGRFLSALTMLLGYTIIAVPTGIVSASMNSEISKTRTRRKCPHCEKTGHAKDAAFCKYCGKPLFEE